MAGLISDVVAIGDADTVQSLIDGGQLTDGRFGVVQSSVLAAQQGDVAVEFDFNLHQGIYRLSVTEGITGVKTFGHSNVKFTYSQKATVLSLATGGTNQPGYSTGSINGGGAFTGHFNNFPPVPDPQHLDAGYDGFTSVPSAELEVTIVNNHDHGKLYCDLLVEQDTTVHLVGNLSTTIHAVRLERGILLLESKTNKKVTWRVSGSDKFEEGIVTLESVE